MAANVQFSELKTRARQYANMERSNFITEPELGIYINASCQELYDKLIEAYDDEYYAKEGSITTDGVETEYSLPNDFYKLLGVDYRVNGADSLSVRKFQFQKRNYYKNRGIFTLNGNEVVRYRLRANKIMFTPLPRGQKIFDIHYIPTFTKLSSASDSFDGVNGWEEYIVLDAAMKMLAKEETDFSQLSVMLAKIDARIKNMRNNRDANESAKVIDTRRINGNYYGDDNGWLD